ncbi:MAG: serine/threonine protein kinase [Bryobacterales bacterium]|nr:serine/threonine protein kinase [Bryobacterales bacterium]
MSAGSQPADYWDKVRELFDRAAELPRGERMAYLQRECAGNDGLRLDVSELLGAITQSGEMLEGVVRQAIRETQEVEVAVGTRLGPYEVIGKLGEGGMGQVFRARRGDDVFQKEVAIKVVPAAFASPALVERFRVERRILAALEHPNIARVLDGGSTAGGAPYLVLEYIDGLPLLAHCEARGLGVKERVQLFRRICDAVQYAHENLIVHRDLKPANVIVTADGTAKLLDFGIAKLLEPGQDTGNLQTRPFERMMTPEYASPEQIRGEAVTTATDVYSLGVMLYELLAGVRPLTLGSQTLGEMERIVCEQEPKTLGAVRRELAGDLENIVAKAMKKRPAERYRSAGALGEDLGRYLEGFPVSARADGAWYKVGKFVRRHKLAMAALGMAVAALAVFVVLLVKERNATERERAAAEQMVQFLVRSFEVADPSQNGGKTATARDILDAGVGRMERELAGQPEAMGRMLATMGDVYAVIGQQGLALRLLERALRLPGPPEAQRSIWKRLGRVQASNGDYGASEKSLRKALSYSQAGSWEQADGQAALAETLRLSSRLKEAEGVAGEALTAMRRVRGGTHPDTADTLGIRGQIRFDLRDFRGALADYNEALGIETKAFGMLHRRVAVRLNNIGAAQLQMPDFPAAERSFLQAIAILTKLYGTRQQDVATAWSDLGVLYSRQERFEKAVPANREALRIYRAMHGDRHPFVGTSLVNLGQILRRSGKPEESLELVRQAAEVIRETKGADTLLSAYAEALTGMALLDLGRLDEAEPHFAATEKIRLKAQGLDNEAVLLVRTYQALVRQRKGDKAGARAIYEGIVKATEKQRDKPGNSRVTALVGLAELAGEAGDWDAVEQGLAAVEGTPRPNVQLRARMGLLRGRLELARGRKVEARAALERAAVLTAPDGAYWAKQARALLR